jgi:dihydrofolate synthase/folylpolyglutamate synthase
VLSQVVVTRTSSPRALDPDELGAIAVSIFGADRVLVVPGLADALAEAVALAEEYGPLAQSGVLVTGSVVTAGEARAMLIRGG